MSKIVKDHNLYYHSYADDTQIYIRCENNATDINTAISRLKDCIADICLWMSNSSLKINEQKTELIIFYSSRSPISVNTPLVVGTDTIIAGSKYSKRYWPIRKKEYVYIRFSTSELSRKALRTQNSELRILFNIIHVKNYTFISIQLYYLIL